jgi:hypothetical protein
MRHFILYYYHKHILHILQISVFIVGSIFFQYGCGSHDGILSESPLVHRPVCTFIQSLSEKSVLIGLTWDNVTNSGECTGTMIIERAILNQPYQEIATVDCSTPSIIDSSLDPQQKYSYRVKAKYGADSSGTSNPLTLMHSISYELVQIIQQHDGLDRFELSADRKLFLTFSNTALGNFVTIWNTSDWSSTRLDVGQKMPGYAMRISQNSEFIVVGGVSTIGIFSRITGSLVRSIDIDTVYITDLALTPACDIIASTDGKGNLRLWDFKSGTLLRSIEKSIGYRSYLAINPSDTSLAVSSSDAPYSLNVWDIKKYTVIKSLGAGFTSPLFNHSGSLLSVDIAGQNKRTNYSTRTWEPLYSKSYNKVYYQYTGTAFSPDDSLQLLIDFNNLIRVIRVSSGETLTSISTKYGAHYVAFAPDGQTIIASDSYEIYVYSNTKTKKWVVANPMWFPDS